jgi:hypothetical protein
VDDLPTRGFYGTCIRDRLTGRPVVMRHAGISDMVGHLDGDCSGRY